MTESFLFSMMLKDSEDNDIFIYTDERNYSYKDTFTHIEAYRDYISYNNFTPPYTALLGNNSADMIFVILALWSLKITPILINTRLTKAETKNLLKHADCRQIIIDQRLQFIDRNFILLAYPVIPETAGSFTETGISGDNTAVVIFTSGSTGSPKGVELTFRTLRETAFLQNKYLETKRGDKWLVSLPLYHIGGFSILIRALINGASLVIPPSLKDEDLMSAIKLFRPDHISLVGTQLKKLLDKDFNPGYKINNILVGGGFTDDKIITGALEKDLRISKVYGSTETAAFIAAAGPDELKRYPSAAGKELVEGSIAILDEEHNPLPCGSKGEIALKGLPLMKGYLKDKNSTMKKYFSGYYLTNDIGYINEDGYLFVEMRRSDLIISGGENIDPKEIEKAMLEIEGIDDVYVFGIADEEWGQSASAVISGLIKHSDKEIKEFLKTRLAGYKIPKQFYYLKEIPRNDLGKIDLTALKSIIDIR
jgi:o-succinylbenzoate---CoA ligase